MQKFDLVVIGSGPAGYVAAIHAAKKGLKVACVEKGKTFGGTCLNVGCIPSKALLYSTELFHKLQKEGKEHGIGFDNLTFQLDQMMARKNKIVGQLTQGIDYLFKKNKVTSFTAMASLLSPTHILLKSEKGEEKIEAAKILLATGSAPIGLPFLPIDERVVLSSTGALSLTKVPKKLLIVGAGVIGLELGSVYQRLGCEVEVVELLDRACATMDVEISKNVFSILKKQGFQFHLSTKVTSGKIENEKVTLEVEGGGQKRSLSGDCVLVAIGRRPFTEGLGLESVGIEKDSRGGVRIDERFCTNIPNIYAVGDLVDGPMLAHKGSEEAIVAVDLICGEKSNINYLAIPNVMYTWPEVACVGMSEQEAKECQLDLMIGKVPFLANSRARTSGDPEGLVKIIGDKQSGRLLGIHIIGPQASEMIGEGVLAIEKKMSVAQLAHASHAHPTFSESIKEAALAALGKEIHI